ncbi:hypothetical protein RJT34_32358 [Clitoria ternatea]|uniref:Desiccation-related protein PCC13-62 n=1 Tax=Clitoria ternatea TaxID=43366 RepID=A0AAN9EXM3_CLITE
MAFHISSTVVLLNIFFLSLLLPGSYSIVRPGPARKFSEDDLVQFNLNVHYLIAELFLFGATGHGLDVEAPGLAQGGPPPIGAQKANLDPLVQDIMNQFGLQATGNIRAIKEVVGGFPRPLLNLSKEGIAKIFDAAFERPLNPPFDAYANSLNFVLACSLIPYVGQTVYVGIIPQLNNPTFKALLARLLAIISGQSAIIRSYLYMHRNLTVAPYPNTVREFIDRIVNLKNRMGKGGVKDEGLVVPESQGAEGRVSGNILAADKYSLSYSRSPEEALRLAYETGDERLPGGSFPEGAGGRLARYYLNNP